MNVKRIAATAFSIILAAGSSAFAQGYGPGSYQNYGGPAAPQSYGQPQGAGGWDAAPPEFRDAQRRGFRDGVEGARRDFENHRQPNVNNRDEFRKPNFIARPDRREYRQAFERGYNVGVRHIYGPGPGGPGNGYRR